MSLASHGLIEEIFRSEAGEVAGGVVLLKGLEAVLGFAKDVVDFLQAPEMAFWEAFLIRNEDVGLRSSDPAGEDALHEDISVEAGFLRKDGEERRGSPAVTDGDLVAGGLCDFTDEIDITVEANSVGASDDVEVEGHGDWFAGRRADVFARASYHELETDLNREIQPYLILAKTKVDCRDRTGKVWQCATRSLARI